MNALNEAGIARAVEQADESAWEALWPECEVWNCHDDVEKAGVVYGRYHARCEKHWNELYPDFDAALFEAAESMAAA
jgi:hypothetical protein